jgi:hypothetical protein
MSMHFAPCQVGRPTPITFERVYRARVFEGNLTPQLSLGRHAATNMGTKFTKPQGIFLPVLGA